MTKPTVKGGLAPANAVDLKGRGCRRPALPGMRRVWPADALGLACERLLVGLEPNDCCAVGRCVVTLKLSLFVISGRFIDRRVGFANLSAYLELSDSCCMFHEVLLGRGCGMHRGVI